MVWPIPSAKNIAAKFAAAVETGLLLFRSDLDPLAVSRAVRSPRGVFANIGSAFSAELREVHDHVAWWGRQYMPDSADDEAMILRHSSIWGVEPRGPLIAVGSVTIEAASGTVLPAAIELSGSNGSIYMTTAGGTVGVTGVITFPATAINAGSAANLEAGIRLSTVTPYPEITRVTVASPFAGGADEQTPAEIQAAYLARIRQPPHGGAGFDYSTWVAEIASVAAVSVVEDWIGRGSLGVVVVLKGEDGLPRSPTADEIAVIQAYLGEQGSQTGVRPVTARVIVIAGELTPIPLSVRLRPDVALTRVAVEDAFARFIATIGDVDDTGNDGPIGATIEPSRISEAVSAAAGEYAHDMIAPAARYTLERTQYPIPGEITWVA